MVGHKRIICHENVRRLYYEINIIKFSSHLFIIQHDLLIHSLQKLSTIINPFINPFRH